MMKTMLLRPGRAFGAVLALAVLAGPAVPANASAQIRLRVSEAEGCRCVDRSGKAVEDCSCVRLPDLGPIVRQALPAGRVRLGITLAEPAAGESVRGAEVASVMRGGPADKAGIRKGDILTRVDGKSLLDPLGPDVERRFDEDASLPVQRLMEIVKGIEPGQKVELEYLRGGTRGTATVEARNLDAWRWSIVGPDWDAEAFLDRMRSLEGRLGEFRIHVSDDARLWVCPGSSTASGGLWAGFSNRCVGGLELLELKPGLAEYFGASRGVLVADVHRDSRLGLQPGDVILAVGDREATDPERVRRILSSYAADETVSLRILRQKREITVSGTLGR